MFSKIKEFLFGKKTESVSEPVPYKLEPASAVEVKVCGCGRSPSGFCVGLHSLSVEEWAVHPENKTVVAAPVVAPVVAPTKTHTKRKSVPQAKAQVKETNPKPKKTVSKKDTSSGPAAIKVKKTTNKKTST